MFDRITTDVGDDGFALDDIDEQTFETMSIHYILYILLLGTTNMCGKK